MITQTLAASSADMITWKGLNHVHCNDEDIERATPVVKAESEDIFDRSNPTVNLLGWTEYDAADLVMGSASGLFGRDVRTQWTGCVMGVPHLFLGIYKVFAAIDWLDLSNIFTNMGKMQGIFTDLIKALTEAPTEVMACKDIVMEIIGSVAWITKHISLTTVTTGLISNLSTRFIDMGADILGLFTSFFGHDLYTFGLDGGSLIISLLD